MVVHHLPLMVTHLLWGTKITNQSGGASDKYQLCFHSLVIWISYWCFRPILVGVALKNGKSHIKCMNGIINFPRKWKTDNIRLASPTHKNLPIWHTDLIFCILVSSKVVSVISSGQTIFLSHIFVHGTYILEWSMPPRTHLIASQLPISCLHTCVTYCGANCFIWDSKCWGPRKVLKNCHTILFADTNVITN